MDSDDPIPLFSLRARRVRERLALAGNEEQVSRYCGFQEASPRGREMAVTDAVKRPIAGVDHI